MTSQTNRVTIPRTQKSKGKMCVCVKCTTGKWVKGGRHFATTSAESQMKGKGNGR